MLALISGFYSMKRLGVFVLPLDGIDTSPSQYSIFTDLTKDSFRLDQENNYHIHTQCFAQNNLNIGGREGLSIINIHKHYIPPFFELLIGLNGKKT